MKALKERTPQAKILMLLSIATSVSIAPFIFFRITQNNWTLVFIDTVIVMFLVTIFTYIYKTNKIKYPSYSFLFISHVGCIASLFINGAIILNWIYPTMLASFFVLKPKHALILNSFAFIIYFPKLTTVSTTSDMVIITVGIIITNILSFSFAHELRKQETSLKKIALEDYLTKTGNRRSLTDELDLLYKTLQDNDKTTASLILLDLDNFKKINDTYGHLIGDKILIELSDLLRSFFKGNKQLFRYGGEEFLVICNNANGEEAFKLAEKFRKLTKNSISVNNTFLTISLGVTEYKNNETCINWIKRVDEALYQAKDNGRDCVAQIK